MAFCYPQDGHPPSKIYQKEEYYRLDIWHLDLPHKIKKCHGWSATIPRMVQHHPMDGHPTSKIKIYQNEVYYRHGIWHLD